MRGVTDVHVLSAWITQENDGYSCELLALNITFNDDQMLFDSLSLPGWRPVFMKPKIFTAGIVDKKLPML